MQSTLATETRSTRREFPATIPRGGLRLLLALISSDGVESSSLRGKLGVDDQEYRSLLDALQRQYLVDVVSGLDGDAVNETLRLTDYGEEVLTRLMERTFELPE